MIQITDNEIDKMDFCGELCKYAEDIINRQKAELGKNEKIIKAADRLIETQKAEIERLKAENKLLIDNDVSNKYPNCVLVEKGRIYTKTLEDYDELIGDISAEAVKECIEKVKNELKNIAKIDWQDNYYYLVGTAFFDNLLKEMVGEDK